MLDFTLELVTPAFLGGADRNWRPGEGLRVPSLRGVLRFWYRAKEGRRASEELFREESRIFGSTGFGQGLRLIPTARAADQPERRSYSVDEKYLGYGAASESWRHPAPAGARFSFRALGTPSQLRELRRCLMLLHLFGGVGGRSRRGWGSVAVEMKLEKGEPFPPPASRGDDLAQWVEKIFQSVWPQEEGHPSRREADLRYSGFSEGAEIRAFPLRGDDVGQAMHDFAGAFRAVRKNHRDVDDLAQAPPAVAFGLPYSAKVKVASEERRQRTYEGRRSEGGKNHKVDRRASPVLFKILSGPGGRLWGVLLYLPASFFGRQETRLVIPGRRDHPVELPDDRAIRRLLADELWTTTLSLP